jgi:anti-anti-sigma regulatory factor
MMHPSRQPSAEWAYVEEPSGASAMIVHDHLTPELAREWGDAMIALIIIETLSRLVVDAEGITFFGTSGLEALERADRPKGFVRLRRPSSSVRRLLIESNATFALTTE